MLKPEKDKAKKQKRGKERDYAEGNRLLFFLPGEVATDRGRWAVWSHSDHHSSSPPANAPQIGNSQTKWENREFPFPSLGMFYIFTSIHNWDRLRYLYLLDYTTYLWDDRFLVFIYSNITIELSANGEDLNIVWQVKSEHGVHTP